MIQATEEFRAPPPGYMGRHFPFDPSQATIPEPAPIDDDGRDQYEVRLSHSPIDGVGTTTLIYQHHPLDVEGWRGDNFAFSFNIEDYNVVTSNSVHPGSVRTNIWSGAPLWAKPFIALLVRPRLVSAEAGARTIVRLAASPELAGVTGRYFEEEREVSPAPLALDVAVARKLWDVSAALVGLPPSVPR